MHKARQVASSPKLLPQLIETVAKGQVEEIPFSGTDCMSYSEL